MLWAAGVTAIVISYRREDSQGTTGRIFDRLESHYGQGRVFMDIDNIPFGTDFRHHLQETLNRCDILLVVVGPRWFGRTEDGQPRLFEEADWVRIEVATALEKKIPVIPLLVEGARMPKRAELPEDLQSFAFRQAATVDVGVDFRSHMERLTKSMDRILALKVSESLTVSKEMIAVEQRDAPISPASPPAADSLAMPASTSQPTLVADHSDKPSEASDQIAAGYQSQTDGAKTSEIENRSASPANGAGYIKNAERPDHLRSWRATLFLAGPFFAILLIVGFGLRDSGKGTSSTPLSTTPAPTLSPVLSSAPPPQVSSTTQSNSLDKSLIGSWCEEKSSVVSFTVEKRTTGLVVNGVVNGTRYKDDLINTSLSVISFKQSSYWITVSGRLVSLGVGRAPSYVQCSR
jgi:hypothetical protein